MSVFPTNASYSGTLSFFDPKCIQLGCFEYRNILLRYLEDNIKHKHNFTTSLWLDLCCILPNNSVSICHYITASKLNTRTRSYNSSLLKDVLSIEPFLLIYMGFQLHVPIIQIVTQLCFQLSVTRLVISLEE